MNTIGAIFLFALIVIGYILTSDAEYKDAQEDVATYCGMVALWSADEAAGVPPEQRIGWPPYKSEINCTRIANAREYRLNH